MRTRPGIPTTYESSNFRSRLEARWAAFFDLIGWRWTYEPMDASGYIPDFLIHGDRPFFVEVGPCVGRDAYRAKAEKPLRVASELQHDVLVVGMDVLPFQSDWEMPCAGLLAEYQPGEDGDGSMWLGDAVWTTCTEDERSGTTRADGLWRRGRGCRSIGVTHAEATYSVRPCGHYPGGRIHPLTTDIERLWREAGNRTQWRAA